MGSKSGSAPQAPNPQMMAGQQTNANVTTAAANSYLNAINQNTPYGSVNWKQTNTRQLGDGTVSIPEWEVNTTLNPEQQKIMEAQQAAALGSSELARDYTGRIRDATATPFNYDGLPAGGTAPVYDKDYRQHSYDTILQRNQPNQDHDRAALTQRLADQGVGLQDPAYATAMRQFDTGLNDFRLGADLQSQQMASSDYGTALQSFGAQNTQRDRAINERLMQRNQPINEVTALLGVGPGVQLPQFQNTQQQPIAPTDTYAPQMMAYQGQMNAYNQQQQSQNAALGGLAGLAGTLGGFALGGPMGGMIGGAAGRAGGGLFGLSR